MTRENSALIALGELKKLETERVRALEEERRIQNEAERQQREAEERARREEQERQQALEDARLREEEEQRTREEREERIRVQQAEAKARAEQEARLKEEQMRLDAQVKMAQRKKTPTWLYGVAGLGIAGIVATGYLVNKNAQSNEENELLQAQVAAADKKAEEMEATLRRLEQEKAEISGKLANLDAQLAQAQTDEEREGIRKLRDDLRAKQRGLDQQIDTQSAESKKSKSRSKSKRSSSKKARSSSRSSSSDSPPENEKPSASDVTVQDSPKIKESSGSKRRRIKLGESDDPLGD